MAAGSATSKSKASASRSATLNAKHTASASAQAERWADTDWEQILLLYDMLLHVAPSPITRIHRAIALRHTAGPRAALVELDTLAGELDAHHLYHATRADLLRAIGRPRQARAADRRALRLTSNPAEQSLLRHRLS